MINCNIVLIIGIVDVFIFLFGAKWEDVNCYIKEARRTLSLKVCLREGGIHIWATLQQMGGAHDSNFSSMWGSFVE